VDLYPSHLLLNGKLVSRSSIYSVNFDSWEVDDLKITVYHGGGVDEVSGFAAIELIWHIRPSALEGKWRHWKKHAWAIHKDKTGGLVD
jgi:hypothetical protein